MNLSGKAYSQSIQKQLDSVTALNQKFSQVIRTAESSWTDRRKNEFYRTHIQKLDDLLKKLQTDLNMIQHQVRNIENTLNS